MRSDCASIPTRGSRFVGLLSIIITSVLGSGACEQESRGSNAAANKKTLVISRRRVILRRIVILTLSEPKGKDLLFACSRPVSLRIRDLSQDRRPRCSRSRRNIARPPMPRLIRQQGKSHCLFCLRRNAVFIRDVKFYAKRSEFLAQHSHQSEILCASARR